MSEGPGNIRQALDRFTITADHAASKELLRSWQKDLPLPKRMVKAVLLLVHDIAPQAFSHFGSRPFRAAGFTVLGAGLNVVAVADGEKSVLKVYHYSEFMSPEQLAVKKTRLERKQELLLSHLRCYSLPQTFQIDHHPLLHDKLALIANQERILEGRPLNPSAGDTSTDFPSFSAKSLAMYDETQTIPDIIGLDNLYQTADGLRLIDTIPVVESDLNDAESFPRALENLRSAAANLHHDPEQ